MTNRILKATASILGVCLSLMFSLGAHAFPGSRGPNTPSFITAPGVTPDTDNTVGAHFMRRSGNPPSMDPNGTLSQHHFQHSGTDGVNPYPINPDPVFDPDGNGIQGGIVTSGAEFGADFVTIQIPNFIDPLPQKRMRIEILAFNDPNDLFATVDSVNATDVNEPNPTVNFLGDFTQADLQLANGTVWDYSYFDYEIFPNPDFEEITIASNGANIGQVFVWTVSEVPIPAAVWLFGTGLAGLATVSRRRATSVTA